MINKEPRILKIPETPRFKKGIHKYLDRKINVKPLFPEQFGLKEMTKSALTKWLRTYKDTMKILKQLDGSILLFENIEAMQKHLQDLAFDQTLQLNPQNFIPTQEPRAFVYPSKRLTDEEITRLEAMGFIPVQREFGETTRLTTVRLDTRTMNKLRLIQKKFQSQGKKITLTETYRLALLKGIQQLMEETT